MFMINQDPDYEGEVLFHKVQHRKKTPKKSNHRHTYKDCVCSIPAIKYIPEKGYVKTDRRLVFWSYCPKCGKLRWFPSTNKWQKRVYDEQFPAFRFEWTEAAKREFNPETRTLPYFEIDDEWQKYVEIEDECTSQRNT